MVFINNINLISLKIPTLDDLWFRQKMMANPETMSYNKGYDIPFEGYDRETGCIDFPENTWQEWFDFWIDNEPDRFYAYIVRTSDGAYIGEVNVHKSNTNDWYEMGIVIDAEYRGQGYSKPALNLLITHAFDILGVNTLHNSFEDTRDRAVEIHKSAGFEEVDMADKYLNLILSKTKWQNLNK